MSSQVKRNYKVIKKELLNCLLSAEIQAEIIFKCKLTKFNEVVVRKGLKLNNRKIIISNLKIEVSTVSHTSTLITRLFSG